MAEENNDSLETQTDIFMQQKKVIDTLVNELARQSGQPSQIVYATPSAQPERKTPNYLIYAAIAVTAIFLFKK